MKTLIALSCMLTLVACTNALAFNIENDIALIPGVHSDNSGIFIQGVNTYGGSVGGGVYFKGNPHYSNLSYVDLFAGAYLMPAPYGFIVEINDQKLYPNIPSSCMITNLTKQQENQTYHIEGQIISLNDIQITGCYFQ